MTQVGANQFQFLLTMWGAHAWRLWPRCSAYGVVLMVIVGMGWASSAWGQTQTNGAMTVSDIEIQVNAPEEQADRLAKLAREMIVLKPGQLFSDKALAQSIVALKASNIFRRIHVPDPVWGPQIRLLFELEPFPRIEQVIIEGAFPLFEREVRNAMTLYAGQIFQSSKLEIQQKRIVQLYQREGYIDPQVSVTARENTESNTYILEVNIDKGPYFKVSDFSITGNHAFSEFRLKMRLEVWKSSLLPGESSRFVAKDVEKDVRNLIQFYREKEYADVTVVSHVDKDAKTEQVAVKFEITEGPLYDITFSGNHEFWDLTLKKDLVLFQKGNRNDLGLRQSLRKIRTRYLEAGYLEATVKMRETEDGATAEPAVRKIVFDIAEGPRSIVETVTMVGNQAIAEDKLTDDVLTQPEGMIRSGAFVPKVLDEDTQAIAARYEQDGYMDVAVKQQVSWTPDTENDRRLATVTFDVDEGVQTLVDQVVFNGLTVLTEAEALDVIKLKPGRPYSAYRLSQDVNRLSNQISERGYPHISMTTQVDISEDKTRATLHFNIDAGPYVEMGQIFITGNFNTRRSVFLAESEIESGAPFSLTQVLKTEKNIRDIAVLNAAYFELIGLKEKAEIVDLLVEAEEKKPYYFQIGGGYDTERHFYANTRVGNRNLFGLNKELWASGEISEIGYKTSIGLNEPRFFNSDISAATTAFAEQQEKFNQDFGTRKYGAGINFNRSFGKHWSTDLSMRYEHREQYRRNDKPIPPDELDQYDPRSILVASPGVSYNSVDSYARPTRGLYSGLAVDVSKGLDNELDDFFKYRFETKYYLTPLQRITFALRGRYGYIDPYGSNERVPDDQLFYLGGTADVRGYDENMLRYDAAGDSVGGRESILGSAEARLDLGLNFELALFFDTGAIREAEADLGSNDFRSSYGAGLRYHTPVGPIGLMYGQKVDRRAGEDAGRFHFTIGYTF